MNTEKKVEKYVDNVSKKSQILQKIWLIIAMFLFRPFSLNIFNTWRILLLKLFGAKIGKGSVVYSSVFIPMPWKLTLGNYCCLGPEVQLHIGETVLGNKVTVSQRSYLCSGTHEINSLNKPFISKKIELKDFSWVAAEAYIGPGVTVGEGAIVGARAAVFKDVDEWSVVGGNPAKFIKKRIIE